MAAEVDTHRTLDVLFGHILNPAVDLNPGVAEQNVKPAENSHRLSHRPFRVCNARDVGMHEQGTRQRCGNILTFGVVNVSHDDGRPFPAECLGSSAAYPFGAAGH